MSNVIHSPDALVKVAFAMNRNKAGSGFNFLRRVQGLVERIKQELEPGMVFALEPKIVLPGIGPVGIENSWVVTAEGVEKLTLCKEEIVEL